MTRTDFTHEDGRHWQQAVVGSPYDPSIAESYWPPLTKRQTRDLHKLVIIANFTVPWAGIRLVRGPG